jgi:hypothetical protein
MSKSPQYAFADNAIRLPAMGQAERLKCLAGFFFGGLIGWVGGRAGAEELWKVAPIVWKQG